MSAASHLIDDAPLTGFQGVLTGVPTYVGETASLAKEGD